MVILDLLNQLAEECKKESDLIVSLVHLWFEPIVSHRNVAFMRELTFVCGKLVIALMCDYVFGMPIMG